MADPIYIVSFVSILVDYYLDENLERYHINKETRFSRIEFY